MKESNNDITISVTGLGYVGLPLALEFAKHFYVIGFDINSERIDLMKEGIDPSHEIDKTAFENKKILFTNDEFDLKRANFHIIGVPTDIDSNNVPNLIPLIKASKSVGENLKRGDTVVYESTVYPGCTEEECVPILEKYSGLKCGLDFFVGYSPERIVPGDKIRTLTKIRKIVSGDCPNTVERISNVYGRIIEAGLYVTPSIKVAEAAKIIENTQRDLNISLMNELAMIFDKMGIDSQAVIEAAATKWNFHAYQPGLVGGHCISVDPYYLIHKARLIGVEPQVIAAGRRVNDYLPSYIAKRIIQRIIEEGKNPGESNVLVLGVTFKENVSDIRNSKVFSMISELKGYGVEITAVDPHVDCEEVFRKHLIVCNPHISEETLKNTEIKKNKFDAIVIAVSHDEFRDITDNKLAEISSGVPIIFDIKGLRTGTSLKNYWKL